jgi:hypothetical protein
MSAPLSLRVASVCLWISAIGLGVFIPQAIRSILAGRGIPRVMGFPAYGEGPFERHGIPTTVPVLVAFLLVCTLDGVAGWSLWGGHRFGAILALVLLPVEALFWWGFSLPYPPMLAIVRTVLILLAWRSLA